MTTVQRLLILVAALACVACTVNFPAPTAPTLPTPSGPVTVTVTQTNQTGSGTTPAPAPGGSTTPTENVLPLPSYGEAVVRQVATTNPTLFANSCPDVGEAGWGFMDLLVKTLRLQDLRWGFLCRDDNCIAVSRDVIAYRAQTGPTGLWLVDVIGDVCGAAPFQTYQVLPFDMTRRSIAQRLTGTP